MNKELSITNMYKRNPNVVLGISLLSVGILSLGAYHVFSYLNNRNSQTCLRNVAIRANRRLDGIGVYWLNILELRNFLEVTNQQDLLNALKHTFDYLILKSDNGYIYTEELLTPQNIQYMIALIYPTSKIDDVDLQNSEERRRLRWRQSYCDAINDLMDNGDFMNDALDTLQRLNVIGGSTEERYKTRRLRYQIRLQTR